MVGSQGTVQAKLDRVLFNYDHDHLSNHHQVSRVVGPANCPDTGSVTSIAALKKNLKFQELIHIFISYHRFCKIGNRKLGTI